MIRMFVFFGLLLAAAFGFSLLLETPGSILLTYGGYEYRVTLAKGLAILIAAAVVIVVVWSLIRTALRLPGLITMTNRMRRKSRGYTAVSRGLVAVGVGDRRTAQRFAAEAERMLGRDPMTLLLRAQSAQLSGDRKSAEAAFTRMLDNPETKVLGLRGLFIEARRDGKQGARSFAEEAYRLEPASPWAGQAVLEYRTAEKDWRGALAAVDEAASRRVIDRETARRQKATLLAAEAQDAVERSPDHAYALGQQALKLNPAHVQAALIVAERLSAKGDYAKATRLLENAWKSIQHPDLADAYLSVRHGDSTLDRLKRARTLQKLAPKARESGLVLAKAAIDARDYDAARAALEPLVLQSPTARACRLMAELEDKESGNAGMVRKWLARASRAPRDPAWVADGFVSDHWAPVSPVTGRIDAFEWITPPQSLETSVRASIDADQDQLGSGTDILPLPAELPAPDVVPEAEEAEPPPVKADVPDVQPAPVQANGKEGDDNPPADADIKVPLVDAIVPEPAAKPVAGVLAQLPDDPGPRKPGNEKRSGMFG